MTLHFEGRSFPLHPTNNGRIGVMNLMAVALFAGSVWRKLNNQLADGKLSMFEAVGSIFTLAEGVQFIPKVSQIREELLDLSEAEALQIIEALGREFGFSPDKAKDCLSQVVVPTIEVLVTTAEILTSAKAMFGRQR